MSSDKQVDELFVEKIIHFFGKDRLICILFYGTNAFNRSEVSSSDYDFYFMLDAYNKNDDINLQKIIREFDYLKLDLTYQYLSDVEKRGWINFQLGNHGIFYVLNFAQAKLCYGYNVFQRKLMLLEKNELEKSILIQTQEYFWRLDNWFLKETLTESLKNKYKKYLIRIVTDLLLLKADISFQEINQKKYNEIIFLMKDKFYFSTKTVDEMEKCFSSSCEPSLSDLRKVQRLLYEDYLQLY